MPLTGNILSVFVLSCPEMRSNFNQLLIALSVFDLLYLVMSLRFVECNQVLSVHPLFFCSYTYGVKKKVAVLHSLMRNF